MRDQNGVIWTPTALIMWPNAFVPSLPKGADPGKTPQYSATAVLSGNEPDFADFRQEIMEELNRASKEKFGTDVSGMRERGRFKLAVKQNGDPDAGKASKPGFKERPNGIHFGATTQFIFPVMDRDKMGMSKDREAEIYSGIFGTIGVTAWGWSHPTGGKGVSLNLVGLWKKFDGDRMGGGASAADMANIVDDGYVPDGAQQAPAIVGGTDHEQQQQQQQQGQGQAPDQGGSGGAGFGF